MTELQGWIVIVILFAIWLQATPLDNFTDRWGENIVSWFEVKIREMRTRKD